MIFRVFCFAHGGSGSIREILVPEEVLDRHFGLNTIDDLLQVIENECHADIDPEIMDHPTDVSIEEGDVIEFQDRYFKRTADGFDEVTENFRAVLDRIREEEFYRSQMEAMKSTREKIARLRERYKEGDRY